MSAITIEFLESKGYVLENDKGFVKGLIVVDLIIGVIYLSRYSNNQGHTIFQLPKDQYTFEQIEFIFNEQMELEK